ncbi:MAG: FecR domain-containing protein [Prolixibacteraceae bacterium]
MKTHDHIPDYLIAYLHGEASEEQELLAVEWLKVSENMKIYQELEKINEWTADLNLLQDFNLQEGKQKVTKKYRANKLVMLLQWTQRVAAILFIPVLLGGIWYYLQQNELRKNLEGLIVTQEIVTQPGTKTHLFLPDGTEVWLNAASSIQFPSAFAGSERRVKLNGEAYFKVFHNKKQPFIVNTGYVEVEALGTAFNLSAYSGDYTISATLEEGKVKITDEKKSDKIMYLDPDCQVNYYPTTNTYKTSHVRVQDVIAWKDGVLIFNETPFYEMAAKLGHWFNADIKITDESIANYRFTGTFTSESLEQVMELLTLSTPISYSMSKRTLMDNRNFTKQEIKICEKSKNKK